MLASDQTLPSIAAFADDLLGVLLVLAFATERELVFGLAVWDLVDTEPFVGRSEKAREVTLNILDVVELGSKRVVDLVRMSQKDANEEVEATHVNHNDLPVRLFFVEEGHDTENFDLLDLTGVADQFTNLADIQWVIVTLGLRLWVNDIGVLPRLQTVNQL